MADAAGSDGEAAQPVIRKRKGQGRRRKMLVPGEEDGGGRADAVVAKSGATADMQAAVAASSPQMGDGSAGGSDADSDADAAERAEIDRMMREKAARKAAKASGSSRSRGVMAGSSSSSSKGGGKSKAAAKAALVSFGDDADADDMDADADDGAPSLLLKPQLKKKKKHGKRKVGLGFGAADLALDPADDAASASGAGSGSGLFRSRAEREQDATNRAPRSGLAAASYSPADIAALKSQMTIVKQPSQASTAMQEDELDLRLAEAHMRALDQQGANGAPSESAAAGAGAPTHIPSQDEIQAARKRREMARQRAGYMDLNGRDQAPADLSVAPHRYRPGARLADEDAMDNSDEDDLGESKMSFGDAARRQTSFDRRQEVRAAMDNLDEGGDEDDADLAGWEEQHIRSGTHIGQSAPPSLRRAVRAAEGLSAARVTRRQDDDIEDLDSAPLPPLESIDALQRKLQQTLMSMNEVHNSHKRHLERIEDDIQDAEKSIPRVEEELEQASARYAFFQETRMYIADLLTCLDEKVPQVEECESQVHVVWKEAADAVVARRKADIDDQIDAACPPSAQNGYEQDSFAAAATARRRDLRIEARAARRHRREQERGDRIEEEGWSTDDENIDGADERAERKAKAESDAAGIFQDVLPAFSEVKEISSHFEEWQARYPRTHRDAFATLSLEKILAPLVKLQLLAWNPLEHGCAEFEDMEWFHTLLLHGMGDGDGPPLIPHLVENVLLPKLAGLVEFVWDPLSQSQTTRLASTIEHLFHDYESLGQRDCRPAQELLAAVTARLRRAADELAHFPSFRPDFPPQTVMALDACFRQQFLRNLKVARAAVMMEPAVGVTRVQQFVLGDLVANKLIPTLRTAKHAPANVVSLCEQLVAVLPRAWFHGQTAAAAAMRMAIAPLCSFFDELAAAIAQMPHMASVPWRPRMAALHRTVGNAARAAELGG